jgi:hypothetical protein
LNRTESGFASQVIPAGREANASHDSHSTGWTEVLQALVRRAENT